MFETIFIWSLYVILPAVLIHRFLGPHRAGIVLATTIFLHQTGDLNNLNLNQVSFPSEVVGSADDTTILVKNPKDTGSAHNFVPNFGRGSTRNNTGTQAGKTATSGDYGSGSSNSGGSGSGSGPGKAGNNANTNPSDTLSKKPIDSNQVPPQSNWKTEMEDWEKDESDDEILADTAEDGPGTEIYGVTVPFDYLFDQNGNPIFYVPNGDSTKSSMKKRDMNRVEYDQTASHMHHAPDHGMNLPANFDLNAYDKMSKKQKIAYAKKILPREFIINYQKRLCLSMTPIFGKSTTPVRGFAGIRKVDVGLVFQTNPNPPNKNKPIMMTIIKDNGQHVSSFPISLTQFNQLVSQDYWVLPGQPFN